MERMNVAIVGLGGMGNLHRQMVNEGMRAARKIDPIECMRVIGSYDIAEARQAFAREKGLTAYPSLDALLADEAVELVICATPNDAHREVTLRALAAGKHVLCEKPAALSVAELDEMAAAADRAGRVLTIGQNRRWDEDYAVACALAESGQLGRVRRIESRVHGSRGIPGDWRKQAAHGGGMLLDWGAHLLDQALDMIPGKLSRVWARLEAGDGGECDDTDRITLLFENGLTYYVEICTRNYISLPRWYLLGERGSAVIEDWSMAGRVVCLAPDATDDAPPVQAASGITKTMAPRDGASAATLPLPRIHSDVSGMYQNVYDAIRSSTEPRVRLPQVRRVLRLMDAIREASHTGGPVVFE